MVKKMLVSVLALTLLVVTGFGISISKNSVDTFNDLAINNIEALAQMENVDPWARYEYVTYYFCGDLGGYKMCHNCAGSGNLFCM
ncbi:NVEALA domain-containing protein [Proteiniphilum acetatigenes]|uniref:NVEALA domain-containing protein n=1 Tax=Proteiniphilum acetatigenes TaxID=294710 RepID=UPI0008EB49EC|nr:NVEALA domain-containing protein [Proteiniphilum acetatigenes]SFL01337.1 NVEALA protein [Porphyromonadaceae bacterium KH3CP3RA]